MRFKKLLRFKKIISVGFLSAVLVVLLSAGTVQASFWDWFKTGGDDQRAAVKDNKTSIRQYTLKVTISGAGKITGIGNSNVINCAKSKDGKYSGTCKAKFNKGDTVVLAAEVPVNAEPIKTPDATTFVGEGFERSAPEKPPAVDGNFIGWGGVCKVKRASVCAVVIDGNKNVSAKFKKTEPSPAIPPPGKPTVKGTSPAGIIPDAQ